ncbi:aquaporin [Multifurca ochricompacta]|uniref:Aquaporin n=1 Tax=Multifurca ochricompacta TaxID=376703 RepID=A0AAD4QQC1_9AGAM|nr:aquaporin [Multifurca ochricompacta]
MSSVPKSSTATGHRHSSSTDTGKFDETNLDRNGRSGDAFNERHEYFTRYPNNWAKIREVIREPAAEMLGTMVLTLLGTGVNCQAVLSANTGVASSQKGDYLSISFGWACGVALGIWVCGGVSGGHVNPVVTLCMAVFRDFPWRKVPGYVLGQLIGAWAGAIIVFGNYFHAIDIVEGGDGKRSLATASLFGTYTLNYMPSANCFFDEFIGTFILLLVVFAITDKRNAPPPSGLVPLVVFITILGIAVAFGMQTGFAINPARDLGPRIMTAMVGYGRKVFNYRSQYWIWSPILGSFSGGLVACFLYDTLIFLGPESFINAPDKDARRFLALDKNVERPQAPSGSQRDEAAMQV